MMGRLVQGNAALITFISFGEFRYFLTCPFSDWQKEMKLSKGGEGGGANQD